jgi:rhodanese-related sulfurtransferase/CBS domain-containing protein
MVETLPKEIDRETLQTLVRRGAQLLEVLPSDEYKRVHITGAKNLPLSMISRSTADRFPWEKPVVTYSRNCRCDQGPRAAWRLASLGFTQVFYYVGGKDDWLANGLPIEGEQAERLTSADLADLDVPTCGRMDRMRDIREKVSQAGWNTCIVVNERLVVLGQIQAVDLEKADPDWTAEQAMKRDPAACRLDLSPEDAAALIKEHNIPGILVTFTDGKLFGFLKKEDLPE